MTSSTWSTQPANGEWNNASNWNPAAVPTDTATFESSSQTQISFSPTGNATVSNISFASGASPYHFTFGTSLSPALTITGQGVSNNSVSPQIFTVAAISSGYQHPQLQFTNSATAGGTGMFYYAGPETAEGYGGGVISFCNTSTAGSATFVAWTGAGTPPGQGSTVGGEISFCDTASASTAHFIVYGTLSVTDGDTFGNVVFHDNATAANGTFVNMGGTVPNGDGGNTQFYNNATAANGTFNNRGGIVSKANGGDVAIDGTATGGQGYFYNYAAPAAGAYGGVTSFNNNYPDVATGGASAGNGSYTNYGARGSELGGGGHLSFSAKYGCPTAADAIINNYGSSITGASSAGHTIFSIDLPTSYFPTAGNATIYNHPAAAQGAAAGYTEFAIYSSDSASTACNVPTAGSSTINNMGATVAGAEGGYTTFSDTTTAGNANLIAYGGSNGGYGGKISFYDESSGGQASVTLYGNGELELGYHTGGVTIGGLQWNGGSISIQLGSNPTSLTLSGNLVLNTYSVSTSFYFSSGADFAADTAYLVLTAANLSDFSSEQFWANDIAVDDGTLEPTFNIDGNNLYVIYS